MSSGIEGGRTLKRNQLIAIVVVVIIAGAAGAYIIMQPTIYPESSWVEETIGNPEFMDPHVNYESFGSWMHFNIYETLYTYPWGSVVTDATEPLLASDVSISADGLNYTFTLRQGVTFHDGTDFNASAVKYNFERVMALFDGWGPAWMFAEPILGGQAVEDAVYSEGEGSAEHIAAYNAWLLDDAIIVMDTYSVRFRLAYPYTPFIAAITYEVGAIMSPTYVEAHGGVVIGEHSAWMDEHACGTGPYMLDEWIFDQHIKLVRNDNYWRAAAAKAMFPNAGNLANVTIITNEDVTTRLLNIQADEVDRTYWPTTHADQIWDDTTVRTADNGDGYVKSTLDNVRLYCGDPSFNVMFLGMNMNPYINQSGVVSLSPFTDINTRRAFSNAFDYMTLIDNVMSGFGIKLQGPIPQGMFGHDYDLEMFEYDLEDAKDAWNLAMADGLDTVWANLSYSLTLYFNSGNTVRETACMLLKDGIEDMLALDGATQPGSPLTIEVQGLEWANYLYQVRNRQLPIFFLGWAPDYADPDNYVGPFVKSTGTFPLRVGLGDSDGWDADEVDGWISSAAQSQDVAAREAYYFDIQEAIMDHVAYIWCYQGMTFQTFHANAYGFYDAAPHNPMHNVYYYHMYKM